jgi:putative ABC transport system substrate-binding protein
MPERLPALAAELIRSKVDVIVTAGTSAAVAARKATATIAIVMATGSDPVGIELVASLDFTEKRTRAGRGGLPVSC